MSDDKATKPTLETVLERINAFGEHVDARFAAFEERIDAKIGAKINALEGRLDVRIDRLENRFDRLEAVLNATRGDILEQRVELRDLRKQIQEHFPAVS